MKLSKLRSLLFRSPFAASANAPEDVPKYYVYRGRKGDKIPRDVTHLKIHSSVRAIKERAFFGCMGLEIVILNDGLEEIGECAFMGCYRLERIVILNAVKVIKAGAFSRCRGLTSVTLGDGLEEIRYGAFCECRSLQQIVIPNSVKRIMDEAYMYCFQLTTLALGDGLEEIGRGAFEGCRSLQNIVIPNSVKRIENRAFWCCPQLTTMTLGNGLEEVGRHAFQCSRPIRQTVIPNTVKTIKYEAMLDWWDQGVHEKSLSTYCFLVRCSIPGRILGVAVVSSWQATICKLLSSIPTVSTEGLDAYFDIIDSKLTVYENLLIEAPMLFPEQFGFDDGVVLNILSFL